MLLEAYLVITVIALFFELLKTIWFFHTDKTYLSMSNENKHNVRMMAASLLIPYSFCWPIVYTIIFIYGIITICSISRKDK